MAPDNAEGTGEGAGPKAARELLIDRQLPRFDAHSFNALIVDADADQAYRAVRALDPEQVAASVPFMRLMGQARALPARLASRHRDEAPQAEDTLSAEQAGQAFVPLDEEPGTEFVVG